VPKEEIKWEEGKMNKAITYAYAFFRVNGVSERASL
jgi:hypothetical protein